MLTDLSAEEQNETRAYWAAQACEAMGELTGQTGYFDGPTLIHAELLTELAGDLIGNLFHLARMNGVEPETLIDFGMDHFKAEVREEEEEAESGE
ncbi:hypothetical protein ACN20G_23330 [Streptomyces sp. BI20]|uniref:hypothetical protein n=1 Tax=Streptomyces sp. BI20 TaxID=3403460 RepID=UPI003C7157F2